MGSEAHLLVVPGEGEADRADELLAVGWARVDELEDRWSRFRPDSEVSALNRHPGAPVIVSDDTVELVRHAVAAWALTGGRFDPTVGAALVAHGYDRDLAEVVRGTATVLEPPPVPGPAGIVVDPDLGAVLLPAGVTFDPGGIGKGLAADMVARAVLAAGAAGVLVNLGGDLRAAGEPPDPDGWPVSLPDPTRPGHEMARFALPWGAVATTSRLRRRWRTTRGEAHHVIDPTTGRPADTEVAAVTVVADQGWRAEAIATAMFLGGVGELARHPDVHVVVVDADGRRHATAALEGALR
jgi:thiamine biosynthesis lipoprotein